MVYILTHCWEIFFIAGLKIAAGSFLIWILSTKSVSPDHLDLICWDNSLKNQINTSVKYYPFSCAYWRFFFVIVGHLRMYFRVKSKKSECAFLIFSLLHFKQNQHVRSPFFLRKFDINLILQLLSRIVLCCITPLDPVYLHNSNATLKDINRVTVLNIFSDNQHKLLLEPIQ